MGSLVLLALALAIGAGIASSMRTEIVPALAAGSLSIDTDSMILGRVWHGNELYVILAIYAVVFIGLVGLAVWLARRAIRGPERQDSI
jgi:hypothetical protein